MLTKNMMNEIIDHDDSYTVVHPLFDVPEAKLDPANFGAMKMTPAVKWSLMFLRFYLIAMVVLVAYRMLVLAGVLN